jgi:tungstate transport system substrate-binding protein
VTRCAAVCHIALQEGSTAVLVPRGEGFWIVEPIEVCFASRKTAAVMIRLGAMDDLDRRCFVFGSAGAALAAGMGCRDPGTPEQPEVAPAVRGPADSRLVRVASVPTAVEGNVLPVLIREFEQRTSYKVELTTTVAPYDAARAGKVDLAISHYGHKHAEEFVVDGLGEWPRTIFSNQLALVGPNSDPAGLRGIEDAGEAFRRIAAGKHLYLVNELDGLRYVTEILWHLAGRPDRRVWMRSHEKDDALIEAAKSGAYVLWGLTPFLRTRKRERLALDAFALGDPLFQRLMVAIAVKPKIDGINVDGARAFQQFLLEPASQAHMRTIGYSEDEKIAVWVPAGRHNRNAVLPGTKG